MRTALVLLLVGLAAPAWAASNVLTWNDNSNNETSFKVERTVAAPNTLCTATTTGFAQIGSTPESVTTFTDPGIDPSVEYCYRVRASNAAGDSAYSNTAGRFPGAPSNLKAVGGP